MARRTFRPRTAEPLLDIGSYAAPAFDAEGTGRRRAHRACARRTLERGTYDASNYPGAGRPGTFFLAPDRIEVTRRDKFASCAKAWTTADAEQYDS